MYGHQQSSSVTRYDINETAVAVFVRISIVLLLIVFGTLVATVSGYLGNHTGDEWQKKEHPENGETINVCEF